MTLGFDPALLLEQLPDPAVVLAPDGEILWANEAAQDQSGLDGESWRGVNVLELLHPDDHATVLNAFVSVQDQDGAGGLIDVRVRHTSGQWRPCELRGRITDDGRLVVILRATSDRQALELGAGGHERLRALVHHAHTILASLDADGVIRSVNSQLTRTLGVDNALMVDRPFDQLLVLEDRALFRDTIATMDASARLEVRAVTSEGATVHLDVNLTDLRTDELHQGYTVCATDVTDLKTTQRALRHMADHDALTGLLNRRALLSQLDTMVEDGIQHEIAILFCDLDGFKAINDRIGHAAGDQVLVEVARRLERSVRPGDLVGRLGGDEFVIVLPQTNPSEAATIAAAIRNAVIEPMMAADEVVEIDLSIGSASTGDSPTAARLLATADDAMYTVKRHRARR